MSLNQFFKKNSFATLTGGLLVLLLLFFNISIPDKDLQQIAQVSEKILQEQKVPQNLETPQDLETPQNLATPQNLETPPADSESTSPTQSTIALEADDGAFLVPVVSVTDGDTIKVDINGTVETVRIVNINTPETVDPRKAVECMGVEASEKMKELVLGKNVILQHDITQQKKDRYGRLLRFVFLEDGTDVGLEMIKLGFAVSTPYGASPHEYLDIYEAAQKTAKRQNLGLWNKENCD